MSPRTLQLLATLALFLCTAAANAQTGACCTTACNCTVTAANQCTNPSVFYTGVTCSPLPCLGACCNVLTGICTTTPLSACSGVTLSWNCTICAPCVPNPIICCDLSTGTCVAEPQAPCPSGTAPLTGACSSQFSCSGACCSLTTCACSTITTSGCPTGSTFMGPSTACSPSPCLGRCSNLFTCVCTTTTQANCSGSNVVWNCTQCFHGDAACCDPVSSTCFLAACSCPPGSTIQLTACSPNCGLSQGACCNGTACSMTFSVTCSGSFQGTGTACGAANNPTTCCPANFNHQNGIEVADIFAFINAWFLADPAADFNGGGLAVQDIFDFLNAWFAGC